MCILATRRKTRRGGAGEGGYIADFIKFVLEPLWKDITQKNIKIITNAGGMNPLGLKKAIEMSAKKAGVKVPVVGCVLGDDMKSQINKFKKNGELKAFTPALGVAQQEKYWDRSEMLMSSNAYYGAGPIAACLDAGADIVVTGRCVDSALALGPLIKEFGWSMTDYDKMSAGSLVGHVIECGCHCTGGNFTDWEDSISEAGWDDVGFPIAECYKDGSFIVTKPSNTGGLVSVGTVCEQILYEIGDPSAYILPDVICDWTQVKVKEAEINGKDIKKGNKRNHRVAVSGARGSPPTQFYKVGTTTIKGWRSMTAMLVTGFQAIEKAKAVTKAILKRTRRILKAKGYGDFIDTNIEIFGAETTYGNQADPRIKMNREVVYRLSVSHINQNALKEFGLHLAGFGLASVPGAAGAGMGAPRPKPIPMIRYYSSLLPRNNIPLTMCIGPNSEPQLYHPPLISFSPIPSPVRDSVSVSSSTLEYQSYAPLVSSDRVAVPLIMLCWARSGDKGDCANIGVIARNARYFPLLKEQLTPDAVKKYMQHLVHGVVVRYTMPGIYALNFLLTKALGGGGIMSLRADSQGKSFGQKLLSFQIWIPRNWLSSFSPNMLSLLSDGWGDRGIQHKSQL